MRLALTILMSITLGLFASAFLFVAVYLGYLDRPSAFKSCTCHIGVIRDGPAIAGAPPWRVRLRNMEIPEPVCYPYHGIFREDNPDDQLLGSIWGGISAISRA